MQQSSTSLFTHYHYDSDGFFPQLALRSTDDVEHMPIQGQTCTFEFHTSERFCTGWHDLATGESHPCPDNAVVTGQYHECRHCQQKTGFNPAFYHAASISQQQQARNQLPHTLYLAHFGPNVIKVGITWEGRGIRRLLDQGARSCLILGTFPNADIARQYEAKIAKLPGIAETIQIRQKRQLLSTLYDSEKGKLELMATRDTIAQSLGFTPDNNAPRYLDPYYLGSHQLQPYRLVDLHGETKISGRFLGMVGSTLIAEQDNMQYFLNIGKLRGHLVTVHHEEQANQHAPQQASLF